MSDYRLPRHRLGIAALALLAPSLFAQQRPKAPRDQPEPQISAEELQLKPRIDTAIGKGVEALLSGQLRDGSWGLPGDQLGGRTGLCLYTLLRAGVGHDHPAVRRALVYLDNIEAERTYSATCMMLAYNALSSSEKEYAQRLEELAQKLVAWQKPDGTWGYPHRHVDLSNTQYAALGLWVAQKRKIKIETEVWRKLIDGVLTYREQPRWVQFPATDETGTTNKKEVAGFRYRPGPNGKVTGSMTAAGVAVLQICKEGLGRRIGRDRRRVEDAIDAGVNWLTMHFSVDRNPNGGHLFYYLYGLERVGSLLRQERFGKHWWYLEGARRLLRTQKSKGTWAGGRSWVQTCFALLFLRRATTGRAPTTGSGSGSGHVFAAGGTNADIVFRGAGQQPLALWIDRFGPRVRKNHQQYGIRVVRVEYLAGDHRLEELVGNPTETWHSDTFLSRINALHRGKHSVKARVTVLAPKTAPGTFEPVEVLESQPMEVTIRDVFEPWMDTAARLSRFNLIPTVEFEVEASSSAEAAALAVDAKDGTHWVCTKDDTDPTYTIELQATVRATRLLVSQPAQHDDDLAKFDHVQAIQVRLNNDKKWYRVAVNPDPLAPTEFPFGRARRLRRVTIRITERVRRTGLAGFAEISLAGNARQRKRFRK